MSDSFSNWWNLLELAGIWAAAAATFYAARTALKIAGKNDQLNLKVNLSQMLLVSGVGATSEPFFQIAVTNLGRRQATITSIYWTLSKLTKHQLWLNTTDLRSATLPAELEDGKVATFRINEIQQYGNWYGEFGKKIFAENTIVRREIDLMFLRCWVSTTLGESFSTKAPRKLKKKIREEWINLREADQKGKTP